MYQWKPYFDGKDRFGSDLVAFRKVWSDRAIPSSKNPIGYLNPLELPIESEVFHSRNVTLGNFVLAQQQIDLLKAKTHFTPTGDEEQNCLQKLNEVAQKRKYLQPKVQGNYIVMKKKDTEGFSVGDVRISFEKTVCGPLSLLTQQVQDQDEVFTFREWNPTDLRAKLGKEKTPYEVKGNFAFRNAIQTIAEDPSSKAELFTQCQSQMTRGAFVSKAFGTLLLFIGLFLLIQPTFLFVEKAPLVTFLQKVIGVNAIYAFTALVAATVYFLVSGFAWIVQRPFYTVLAFLICATAVYFTFFHHYNYATASGDLADAPRSTVLPVPA